MLVAADKTGLDGTATIRSLIFYGDRNSIVHRSIQETVVAGKLSALAKMFYDDLKELSTIIPPLEKEDEVYIRQLVETLRDRWFDTSVDLDEPELWRFQDRLLEDHNHCDDVVVVVVVW